MNNPLKDTTTRTVIGPIDHETWYCMRQCNEAINHLKTLKNSVYDIEIRAEQDLLRHFKAGIPKTTH